MPDDDRDRTPAVPQGARGLRNVRLPAARTVRVRRQEQADQEAAEAVATGGGAAVAGAALSDRLAKLSFAIEKMNLAEYTELLRQPWRLVWVNFVAGLARGVGMAIGFSVLGAVLLYVLKNVIVSRLPDLADLTATIVKMVELNLRR